MDEATLAAWREKGVLVQKDKKRFILRLGVVGGRTTPDFLEGAARLATEFGAALHLTTRQSIELHNLRENDVEHALRRRKELKLPPANTGNRVRTVIACPGHPVCRFSAGDTQKLARTIARTFGKFSGLQTKFKIALTGCRNSCAKPQENDIGIMAAGPAEYKVFFGGKISRQPQLAFALDKTLVGQEAVLELIERVLVWLRDNGQKKERLADALARLGKDLFLRQLGVA